MAGCLISWESGKVSVKMYQSNNFISSAVIGSVAVDFCEDSTVARLCYEITSLLAMWLKQ